MSDPSSSLSHSERTKKRVASAISNDHALALYPDTDTPFLSETDKVHRLLPFHVFQHSDRDLDRVLAYNDISDDLPRDPVRAELDEAKFAIDCHRRLRRLNKRFREIRVRDGTRQHPGGEHAQLTQIVVNYDRAYTTQLINEYRALHARFGIGRGLPPPQTGVFPTAPHPFQLPPGAVPYPYPPPPLPAGSAPPKQPTSPIPVQLPTRLLPALTSMGIVPVAIADIPKDGPPPACIQHGTTNGGNALSLTINLSLLQPMQMSGLAILLNSLVPRQQGQPKGPSAGGGKAKSSKATAG